MYITQDLLPIFPGQQGRSTKRGGDFMAPALLLQSVSASGVVSRRPVCTPSFVRTPMLSRAFTNATSNSRKGVMMFEFWSSKTMQRMQGTGFCTLSLRPQWDTVPCAHAQMVATRGAHLDDAPACCCIADAEGRNVVAVHLVVRALFLEQAPRKVCGVHLQSATRTHTQTPHTRRQTDTQAYKHTST